MKRFRAASRSGNKKECLFFLCLVLLSFNFSGCDFSWQRYYNQEYRFSMLLPRFWQKTQGAYGTLILAQEPQRGRNDKFSENINLVITEFSEGVSLAAFYELNKEELLKSLAIMDLAEGEIFAGVLPGRWLSFKGRAKEAKVKVLSAVFVKGKRAYTITCISEEEKYLKYEPTFLTAIRSLRPR